MREKRENLMDSNNENSSHGFEKNDGDEEEDGKLDGVDE